MTGHTGGTIYTWDIKLQKLDRQRKVASKQSFSLGGRAYTTYQRGDTLWVCQSNAVTGTERDQWREFLDSVEDGQLFGFGPYTGATASPSDRRTVVLDSEGYTENREVRRSVGGASDYFSFAFTLRETA